MKNKRVCGIMVPPSENFLDSNSAVIPALTDNDADHCQQMLQSRKTSKPSKCASRAKLSPISLEEYMNIVHRLTGGKGNVVQPNCDIRSFTAEQLRSVARLHGLKFSSKTKGPLFSLPHDSQDKSLLKITSNFMSSTSGILNLPKEGEDQDNLLLSLVGVELWNPFTLPLGSMEPGHITDEEMKAALHVLQW